LPFILRKLDCSISFTVRGGTVTYADPSLLGTGCATGDAQNNFCLNCHRADVYSFDGSGSNETNENFSRIIHPEIDNPSRIFGGKTAVNGIICMSCHGGAFGRLGLIHGSDRVADAGSTCPTSKCGTSAHLLAINGGSDAVNGEWAGYDKGMVGTQGQCIRTGSAICGNSAQGALGGTVQFDY
jgi:hypothetical protein